MHSRKQGNGLLLVLFVASAIAFGVYSVSDLIKSESRLNKRSELYIEAKQAAESLIQNSIADLERRFTISGSLDGDALSPDKRSLFVSNDFLGFHNNPVNKSNLTIPAITQYTDENQFFSQDTEVIGGRILFDNSEGVWAVEVFAKATVNHPVLGSSTAYASQIMEISNTYLFEFAIFYNLPMEIAPGPRMDVFDKVHVNGDMYTQSNRSLNFNGRVTVAGKVNHGRHPNSGMSTGQGEVNFTDKNGRLINMKKNDLWPVEAKSAFSGTWLESDALNTPGAFDRLAKQIWNGNLYDTGYGLLNQESGIKNIDLPGLSKYAEGTKNQDAFNSGYTIIQPTLNKIEVPTLDSDPEGYQAAKKMELAEKNKFAYNAGLTIQVNESGSLNYYTYERDAYERVVYNADGSPKKIQLTPTQDVASAEFFSKSNNTVSGGLYDKRQGTGMNLVNVDISKLKDLVQKDDTKGENGEDWGGSNPVDWWNGVVYVEFPQQNQNSTRPDNVNPAKASNWGVKLVNGETIPNPTYAQSQKSAYGTSIATNLPMYVEGNYNSDGNFDTGSATKPDNLNVYKESDQEAPAALAADAITFLSENWNDEKSDKGLGNRIAKPTEVSAAILTGLVPSGKNGVRSYSGGVENFPRFLENWSGKEFRMRGSIVAMFESEVATAKWGSGGVYNPPRRSWGFHERYANGNGPPGGPFAPQFRARDLRVWSQQEYEDRIRNNWNAGTP